MGWGARTDRRWIVPVAGYYLPQSQLANAVRNTDPHQLLGRSGMAPPVLFVWWVLYVAAHLTSFAGVLTNTEAASAFVRSSFDIGSFYSLIDRLEVCAALRIPEVWRLSGTSVRKPCPCGLLDASLGAIR